MFILNSMIVVGPSNGTDSHLSVGPSIGSLPLSES
uniref:Uncharacterized protein n=1 Tax=Arundo donax TaxID=35708 RepID=A0A0A8ZQH3_ARUDO